MNPEIAKLQILNDLIAQTIDAITQRSIMAQRAALMGGGFSHTPYTADPRLAALNALNTVGVNPMVNTVGFGGGLGHTTYGIDSRLAWANLGGGLNHTAFDPRFATTGLGVLPQTVPFAQPGFGVWPQTAWNVSGLQHTPYVDPRIGYDPRLALANLGVPHGVHHTVGNIYGMPFGF